MATVSNKRIREIQRDYFKELDKESTKVKHKLSDSSFYHYMVQGLQTEKWLILSDVHVPFQNDTILNKVIYLATIEKFDGIILNGDFLDLYSIASFNDNSVGKLEGVTLGREYEQGRAVLDRIDGLGIEKKVFMFGNHEERFDRFINKGDNAKLIGALGRPEHELELEKRGWEVITSYPDGVYTLGNNLDVIHGIYTNMHPSKKHLQMSKRSIIFGHTHRMDCFFDGKFGAWNIGGLYDKQSKGFDYVNRFVRNQWVNGFGIVHIDDLGNHYVDMINCYNNSFSALGHYL